MNKLTKVAVLPALALCGAFFSSSVFATGRTGALADLPETLAVNVKESAILDNENTHAVDNAAKTSVETALTTVGHDLTGYNLDIYCGLGGTSIYDCWATLYNPEGESVDSADFTITYSNTNSISEADRTEIKNKLNLGSLSSDPTYMYIMHEPGSNFYTPGETVCTENTCGSTPAEFSENFYQEEQATLQSKLAKRAGENMDFQFGTVFAGIATPTGFETSSLAEVYVVQDDVVVDCGMIASVHGYGYELSDGSVVTYQGLNPKGNNYTTMANKLKTEGYTDILGAYELVLTGSHTGSIPVEFKFDSKYDGKTVIILHKKSDGTYEEFEKTIVNGKVSVEVSGLSPFIIALKESSTTSANNVTVKSPNTGVMLKGDNSGANASIIATIVSAILSLSAFVGFRKIAKSKE